MVIQPINRIGSAVIVPWYHDRWPAGGTDKDRSLRIWASIIWKFKMVQKLWNFTPKFNLGRRIRIRKPFFKKKFEFFFWGPFSEGPDRSSAKLVPATCRPPVMWSRWYGCRSFSIDRLYYHTTLDVYTTFPSYVFRGGCFFTFLGLWNNSDDVIDDVIHRWPKHF